MSFIAAARKQIGQVRKAKLGVLLLVALLLSAASLFFFAWLAEEMLEGDARRFDDMVRSAVHGFASPGMTHLMQGLSFLGSVAVTIALTLLAASVLYYYNLRRAIVFLGVIMAGAGVLDLVLKHAFHRVRPTAYFGNDPASYSFPSGHALGALCFYGALAIILSVPAKRVARLLIWTVAVLLVAGIGLSRIYLGVHYPSDVVAGYSAAIVWLGTVYIIDKLFDPAYSNAQDSTTLRA